MGALEKKETLVNGFQAKTRNNLAKDYSLALEGKGQRKWKPDDNQHSFGF